MIIPVNRRGVFDERFACKDRRDRGFRKIAEGCQGYEAA